MPLKSRQRATGRSTRNSPCSGVRWLASFELGWLTRIASFVGEPRRVHFRARMAHGQFHHRSAPRCHPSSRAFTGSSRLRSCAWLTQNDVAPLICLRRRGLGDATTRARFGDPPTATPFALHLARIACQQPADPVMLARSRACYSNCCVQGGGSARGSCLTLPRHQACFGNRHGMLLLTPPYTGQK